MNLDEQQKRVIGGWIDQGLTLSDIQKRLAADLGINLRYMEVRFLLDDLKLQPKDPAPAPTPPSNLAPTTDPGGTKATPAAPKEPDSKLKLSKDQPPPGIGVSVTVDQVMRPGALVSGKVTFSDGQTAAWYLDQMGRLGLAPQQRGYKPIETDIMEFQTLLQQELMRLGYA